MEIFSLDPKKSNFSLTIFQTEILSDITWLHAIFGAIFGKMCGCFDKMGACSKEHVPDCGWSDILQLGT